MARLLLFNKPFNVLSQFTDSENRDTLANYISEKNVYPAGRLDYDSEGLLILVDNGQLQARISDPQHKLPKTYWAQLEGEISEDALEALRKGLVLKDGPTRPARAERIADPDIWPRTPPVRERKSIATSWISLTISEGRNRQVRRMTANVGYPTLRLIRVAVGPWKIGSLKPGDVREEQVHMPTNNNKRTHKSPRRSKAQ